ncbi:hypothetical protein Vadar_020119 [Vaccinium darrowii]|uniref:Uncharacterized protein n=1 Tax=Vaccinium darrowii TaxID=229202 RepID=A0ACB7Y978_9ERIC|nr:hypothetical protein Vadar_020119 [Vaccinium darrowii]
MTTGKAGPALSPECCMCGDYGLSTELFNCKVCQFRSQHRYCSNQYPKAESYRVCNWCLIQTEKTQISPNNSSSSNKTPSSQDHDHVIKKKKKLINGSGSDNNLGGQRGQRGNLQTQVSIPIKKQLRSPEGISGSGGGGCPEKARQRWWCGGETYKDEVRGNIKWWDHHKTSV